MSEVIADYHIIRKPPVDPSHGVRLQDLRDAQYNYLYNGVPISVLFPGASASAALDKTAIYVEVNGAPTTARNNEDKSTGIVGIRNGNFVFLNNTIIKNWSIGMTPGTEYFLTASGTLGQAPTEEGRWNIRLGIALTSTDLLTSFHISGKS